MIAAMVGRLSAATLVFGIAAAVVPSHAGQETGMSVHEQQVVALLKSIETGDPAPASVIDPGKYIQHNLAVADGLEGFAALLAQLPPGSAKVNTIRVFQDGAYVFAHSEYDFLGPKIGFDVFRFENGSIVEHWDNLQDKPASPNPSGRTMTDGPSQADDLHATQANKTLVRRFVEDVLVNGRLDRLASYFEGDNYLQHNPLIADGLSGLTSALKALADQGVTLKYDRIHQVLGKGNFVLVMSEGEFAGAHTAFFDLFRVQNGKIAEHWDTIETIPLRSGWKNTNGKF